jgi:hypothetical protein
VVVSIGSNIKKKKNKPEVVFPFFLGSLQCKQTGFTASLQTQTTFASSHQRDNNMEKRSIRQGLAVFDLNAQPLAIIVLSTGLHNRGRNNAVCMRPGGLA